MNYICENNKCPFLSLDDNEFMLLFRRTMFLDWKFIFRETNYEMLANRIQRVGA